MQTSSSMTAFPICAFAYKFTGKERDKESGLDYFGARYYPSNMGRWMSPDPVGIGFADAENPQSLNLYTYVNNNPLSFVDPNGMLACGSGAGGPGWSGHAALWNGSRLASGQHDDYSEDSKGVLFWPIP
jgi:RHS repeat-associated protein